MGRKHRLSNPRKNSERKRYAARQLQLRVAIPLHSVSIGISELIVSIPRSIVTSSPVTELCWLQTRLRESGMLPQGWVDASQHIVPSGNVELVLFKPCCQPNRNVTIGFTLRVEPDFCWKLFLSSEEVHSCPFLASVPGHLNTVSQIVSVLTALDSAKICEGNPDAKFHVLSGWIKGVFMDPSGTQATAKRDENTLPYPTIRHRGCCMLLAEDTSASAERCKDCGEYRKNLRAQLSRQKKAVDNAVSRTDPASHVNIRYLRTPEMETRIKLLHDTTRTLSKKIGRLEAKIDAAAEKAGIIVDEGMHQDITAIMKSESAKVASKYPASSFHHQFWEQQLKAASCKNSRGMRWHPLMIRWCLYLRHKSSSAYETLRDSGVIVLPSQRTLRDYTHHISARIGFSHEIDQQLMDAANIHSCEEWQKCVALIFDEMHIREDLVYDKHSGALIGFANLGEINSHLLEFERSLEVSQSFTEPLANSMTVFMVRGLFTRLQFPYAQFPSIKVSGDLLFEPFWEAVERLERCQLKVLAATADGASVNRKLFKLLRDGKVFHKVVNPFAPDCREIFFFSDPPHLLKTARNCMTSTARNMMCNGKSIRWQHVVDLYHRNSGAKVQSPGLSLLPKLKYEHVHLTAFSKMRVDLAAQVLSESVAKALKLTGGPEAEETAEFISNMDKFFDCLNVNNFTSGIHHRKPFQLPYRSGDDFRLKWLKEDFLPYLDNWEKSVQQNPDLTDTEKNRMLLSPQTLLGLRMSANSLIELVKYLFTLKGVQAFLSERLCQDPLEKFFGCQRQRGGMHENPNVQEFCTNTQALRVVNSFCRDVVKGNCRGNKDNVLDLGQENKPIPKRKQARDRKKEAKM